MRNRFVANVATIAMFGSGLSLLASSAHAQTEPAHEERATSLINAHRSDSGIASLRPDPQLAAAARRHAQRMADDAEIYHNRNLYREVDGFERLAENVGIGWSVDSVDQAFMASDGHRINILGSFTRVGLGVVDQAGDIYVVQVFGRPAPKSKPSADEPKAKAKPKPKPKHNHKKHNHEKKQPAKPKPKPKPTPTTTPSPKPTPSQEAAPEQTQETAVEPGPAASAQPTPEASVQPDPDPSVAPTPDPSGSPTPQPSWESGKSFPLPSWLRL